MRRGIFTLLMAANISLILGSFKSNNMTTNINDFLKKQVDEQQTPSIQYAFFDTDSTIFELQYGLKRVITNEKISAATTYHLFSVTKTFTAVAVLQLAQAGKIDLDRPVSAYLPSFAYSNYITVKELLNHTAGMPNPMPLRWIHTNDEHEAFNRDELFQGIFRQHPRLDFSPGSDFKYSNLGYVVLGQLVEKISGLSFEEYVESNIIRRLDLTPADLSFKLDTKTHAVGYHKRWTITNALFGFLIDKDKFMGPHEGVWKPFRWFYNNGAPYGGMFGSSVGLTRYAQALLKKKSPLLDESHMHLLFTESQVAGKPTGMSFSWFTGTLRGHRYFAHAGGGGGYYVELRVYPDLGVGSVIMYNRSGMRDERILDQADSFFIVK